MRKVRIGKDFRILWTVTVNGEYLSPEYKDRLTLVLVNPRLSAMDLDFYIAEGKIIAEISHTIQKYMGLHKLSLWYTDEDGKKSVLDEVEAFSLVRFTTEENWGEDDNVSAFFDLDLEGDLMVSFRGESAYETWLKNGFTGTEMDFLEWLQAESYYKTSGKEYTDIDPLFINVFE